MDKPEDALDLPKPPSLLPGGKVPELEIVEQPKQRGFRFRYSCEGPSHGGLPGERSERNRKTYPTVRLNNYDGSAARVVVSLVTLDDPPRPHAHSLVGRHVVNGQCTVQVGAESNWMASFNLGVLHVTKKNVARTLLERYALAAKLALAGQATRSEEVQAEPQQESSTACDGSTAAELVGATPGSSASSPQPQDSCSLDGEAALRALPESEKARLQQLATDATRHMNLSVVRLCFQAYLEDDRGHFTVTLPPCISQPVYDSKAPSATSLKICRMDRHAGNVVGGDELFLLCDRVQKDDIEVRFFEPEKGSDEDSALNWSACGVFMPADVHRQFAIVVRTPPYWNLDIDHPVNVWVQLKRKSDGDTSEAKPFLYKPRVVDEEGLERKRAKTVPNFSTDRFDPALQCLNASSAMAPTSCTLFESGQLIATPVAAATLVTNIVGSENVQVDSTDTPKVS